MMMKYRVLITAFFLLLLATGLYGKSDDQPKWNTTLFGAFTLNGGTHFSFGGVVGYRFTPRLELEGEIGTFPGEGGAYFVSEGVLYNFDNGTKNAIHYVLGGFSQIISLGNITNTLMFGGGLKMPSPSSFKIRVDFRLFLMEGGILMRISTGLMWSF